MIGAGEPPAACRRPYRANYALSPPPPRPHRTSNSFYTLVADAATEAAAFPPRDWRYLRAHQCACAPPIRATRDSDTVDRGDLCDPGIMAPFALGRRRHSIDRGLLIAFRRDSRSGSAPSPRSPHHREWWWRINRCAAAGGAIMMAHALQDRAKPPARHRAEQDVATVDAIMPR